MIEARCHVWLISPPALRKAESRIAREINATSYSVREFRKKVAAKDHFLTEVLLGSKEFVQGNQRDLDEIAGKPRRSAPSDVEKEPDNMRALVAQALTFAASG